MAARKTAQYRDPTTGKFAKRQLLLPLEVLQSLGADRRPEILRHSDVHCWKLNVPPGWKPGHQKKEGV